MLSRAPDSVPERRAPLTGAFLCAPSMGAILEVKVLP
jgi:hypothetical protein